MKGQDKPKIAIFDFTDCEGCEVEFINLKEVLLDLLEGVDIVNWRLAKEGNDPGPFDIAIIEGTPVTLDGQQLLKDIRERSGVIIALGACACTGGVPAIVEDEVERPAFNKQVYPPEYVPRGNEAKPLSHYVKVEHTINGCPVDKLEIARYLAALLSGQKPEERDFPVCLECKIADNRCLLANDKPCLGPITRGGCGAFCVGYNKRCYGCYGLVADGNFDALADRLNEIQDADETERMLNMFMRETEEYSARYKK